MKRGLSIIAAFAVIAMSLLQPGTSAAGPIEDHAAIARLYRAAFDRLADEQGLAYWHQVYADGTSLNDIADYFVTSAEFQNTYGQVDDTELVDLIYRNVLKRGADPGGLEYWVGLRRAGYSQGTILNGFAQSPEFSSLVTPALPERILMIGDSIFHGLGLLEIPVGSATLTLMTEEGRQVSALPDLLDQAEADKTLQAVDAVVIHLGTNGWVAEYDALYEAEVAALAPTPVFVVNTEVDRTWEATANTRIAGVAASHAHVHLVDWNAEVASRPGWMRPDGVHLTSEGLRGLAALIERQIAQTVLSQ